MLEIVERRNICTRLQCENRLPHYHCVIPGCGKRILLGDGDPRITYHPCCSLGHIRIYNVIFFCKNCKKKLWQPASACGDCGADNSVIEIPVVKSSPITNLKDYKEEHPIRTKKSPKKIYVDVNSKKSPLG